MTGRQLYSRYTFHVAQQSVEIDEWEGREWEDLDEHDQVAWNLLASDIPAGDLAPVR